MSDLLEKINQEVISEEPAQFNFNGLVSGIGAVIGGLPKITSAIKAGAVVFSAFSGLLGIFKGRPKVKIDLSQIENRLRDITSRLDALYEQHNDIFIELHSIEANLLREYAQGISLDLPYTQLQLLLSQFKVDDINKVSGHTFYLARNEYRPSKIDVIIKGFEYIVTNYRGQDFEELLNQTIVHARFLHSNLIRFKEVTDKEIECTVGEMLSFHNLLWIDKPDNVDNEIDYQDPSLNYGDDLPITYFNVDYTGDNKVLTQIVKYHMATQNRVKELMSILPVQIDAIRFMGDYISDLINEKSQLIELAHNNKQNIDIHE